MKWLRSNIRHGARLALFTLAIQFALSFGHFHGIATPAAPSIQSTQQLPASNHDSDQHPDDICAICVVIALTNAAAAAAAPALPVPQAVEFTLPEMDAAFVPPRSARASFRSRAPPLT